MTAFGKAEGLQRVESASSLFPEADIRNGFPDCTVGIGE
jgi:hypothetical protein